MAASFSRLPSATGVTHGPRSCSVAQVTEKQPVATKLPTTPAAGTATSVPSRPVGRIPALNVRPTVGDGDFPTKSVVGEPFTVTATVFREGHDAVNASVAITDPDGVVRRVPMTC